MLSDAVTGPRAPVSLVAGSQKISAAIIGRPGVYDHTFSFLQGTSLKMDGSGVQRHFSFHNFQKYFYLSRTICRNTKVLPAISP